MQKNWINADNIVDQKVFREMEALCVQQEPPACRSGCPLHLDVRTFCTLIENKKNKQAFTLLQKTIPFSRIVAYICDAPCQVNCKRNELGGAIEIQKLEKYVVQNAGMPMKQPLMIPKKEKQIAIIGSSLRGLTAAGQLSRKGFQVTLFEKTKILGGKLRKFVPHILPEELLEQELNTLLMYKNLTWKTETDIPIATSIDVEAILLDFDVVYIATESPLEQEVDEQTLIVHGQTHVVAGHRSGRISNGFSAIYEVYDGLSAAYTIDRILQNVSIVEGRDKEGSQATNLFVNLDDVTFESASIKWDEEGAQAEAKRCIQCECMECVKKCGFMQHYQADPSRYLREVINNLSIALGNHIANKMIDSCALCSQCGAICPNGLDIKQVFLAARERMVQTKKMPASAFEFALQDMEYSLSDKFYLLKHQVGYKQSKYIFFPGCQLGASEPALVRAVYEDLCQKLEGGVGIWLSCCGIMARWAGEKVRFDQIKEQFTSDWAAMGRPQIIWACPSCQTTFQEQFEIEGESLFSFLQGEDLPSAQLPIMALHHACGARYQNDIQESVQTLCQQMGVSVKPIKNPNQDPCCGYGGLAGYSAPEVAEKITISAIEQLVDSSEEPILCYCVNCRDRYLAQGQPAFHILEIRYSQINLRHRPPTISDRQYNRAKLQYDLLRDLWNEEKEKEILLSLLISPELDKKLDKDHILHCDISETIAYAERENMKMQHQTNGHLMTSYRPKNVTFWVEYSIEDEGYRVHNAYSHRMMAVVSDKLRDRMDIS